MYNDHAVIITPTRIEELRQRVLHDQRTTRGLETRETIRAQIEELIIADDPLREPWLVDREIAAVLAEVIGLGPLDSLMDDPEISEIMVNAGREVWVERRGALERVDCRIDESVTLRSLERIIGPLGLRVDRLVPYVDARLNDGSRLNAVIAPLAVDGPCLTIRRFRAQRFTVEDFTASSREAALLRSLVRERKSIIVSGPTGSGKTSLISALSSCIGEQERVISIEDTAELQLQIAHVVRLEARQANVEGVGAVSVRTLVRNALRMRPDRLIVGEVRGAEALDMVTAMHTGHRGSLSTLHANSASDALRRLEVMMLMAEANLPMEAVRRMIASAVDVVVQVDRAANGARIVREIAGVVDENVPQTVRL